MLRANGEFSIRQTDYGIRLVSVAGGTLKLKDELKFTFDIVAQSQARGLRRLICASPFPGQIVSLADDPTHSALVDVVGVRRRVDVSLVEPEGDRPGRLGADPRRFRHEQDPGSRTRSTRLRMLTVLGETQAADGGGARLQR